jgi:hypothetical protein
MREIHPISHTPLQVVYPFMNYTIPCLFPYFSAFKTEEQQKAEENAALAAEQEELIDEEQRERLNKLATVMVGGKLKKLARQKKKVKSNIDDKRTAMDPI